MDRAVRRIRSANAKNFGPNFQRTVKMIKRNNIKCKMKCNAHFSQTGSVEISFSLFAALKNFLMSSLHLLGSIGNPFGFGME